MSPRRTVLCLIWWGIFLFYGVPTMFLIMCDIAGLMPQNDLWIMYLWGGGAMAVATWLRVIGDK